MSIVVNLEHFANIGVAAGVIIILTQDLHGKGHHVVYTDRYYTSPRLMQYLVRLIWMYVGQYKRREKKTPKILIEKMEQKQSGFLECCQCSATQICAEFSRSVVCCLAELHSSHYCPDTMHTSKYITHVIKSKVIKRLTIIV